MVVKTTVRTNQNFDVRTVRRYGFGLNKPGHRPLDEILTATQ